MKGKLDLNNKIVPFNDANFSLFEGTLAPLNFVLNLLTFPDFLISAWTITLLRNFLNIRICMEKTENECSFTRNLKSERI